MFLFSPMLFYQEKYSGKNIWELLPDVRKLKNSNKNPIEV
jgi:hypothetical protein